MATQALSNQEISSAVIRLVEEAQEEVYLISPYLRSWGHLDKAVQSAAQKRVTVSLLYRRDKLKEYESTVEGLLKVGALVGHVERLHAKLYFSEKTCIITSMNLDNSSAMNSEEFGLQSDEAYIFNAVRTYYQRLQSQAEWHPKRTALGGVLKAAIQGAQKMSAAIGQAATGGPAYCIRCKTVIRWNTDPALCDKCLASWARYSDPNYAEKFCHGCGKPWKTSVAKPLCIGCFKSTS